MAGVATRPKSSTFPFERGRTYPVELGNSFQAAGGSAFYTLRCSLPGIRLFRPFLMACRKWPGCVEGVGLTQCVFSPFSRPPRRADDFKPKSVDETKPGLMRVESTGQVTVQLPQEGCSESSVFQGPRKECARVCPSGLLPENACSFFLTNLVT